MSKLTTVGVCLGTCVVLLAAPAHARAQQPDEAQAPGGTAQSMPPEAQKMMEAAAKAGTPGKQHEWLAKKAGMWDFKGRFWMDPSMPPVDSTGTAERTIMLGGRVMAETVKSPGLMGEPFEGYALMGYDNVQKHFWSTWSDNMSTSVMLNTGTCDEQGTCTFKGEYPDPASGAMKTMRMVARDEGPDKEVHEAFDVGPDGKEQKTMELVYTRKK